MGGGKGQAGVSPEVSQSEIATNTALTNIAQQQEANAQQLFNTSFPGFQTAENFYTTLASGDPSAIFRAISPAVQQIDQSTAAAKANILRTGPPGGQTNLAIENADVNRGAQVGNIGASAYLNAPNALAQLAGQGVNQSISSASTGISSYSAGTQALGQLGSQQLQAQQIAAEQKGSTFGSLSSLGGSLAEAGGTLGAAGKGGAGKGGADAAAALLAV